MKPLQFRLTTLFLVVTAVAIGLVLYRVWSRYEVEASLRRDLKTPANTSLKLVEYRSRPLKTWWSRRESAVIHTSDGQKHYLAVVSRKRSDGRHTKWEILFDGYVDPSGNGHMFAIERMFDHPPTTAEIAEFIQRSERSL